MGDWDVMQEQPEENLMWCPPPLNGRTLHTWHRWQAASVNNFWKSSFMLFKTFQHLHLTLDGMADLLGTCYIKTDHCLMLASKDNTTLALPRGSKGCAKVLEGLPMLWRMISSAANFAYRHSKEPLIIKEERFGTWGVFVGLFEPQQPKLSTVAQLINSSNIPTHTWLTQFLFQN